MSAPRRLIHYTVHPADLHGHRYQVEMCIARPAPRQQLALPVWVPGSYLVREFSRHLNHLEAWQAGQPCKLYQSGKNTWVVAADEQQPLLIRYEIHALDESVRAAWLDTQRGFFNGCCLFLQAQGQEQHPHAVTVRPPAQAPDWQLATAMQPVQVDDAGFGDYSATDYDELVDHPFEMGHFWSGCFQAGGWSFRFVVAGAPPSFDGERLLTDTQKLCETQIRFWHGDTPPVRREYVFMLNAVGDGYGGLEHRDSTALICNRRDLPRRGTKPAAEGDYQTLLGVISHEYFHSWNVKRMKPATFCPYDFNRENYTELLWFFEGFTSYYDDLLLLRAGLLDEEAYLDRLAKAINQVRQAPGRQVQSVASASFDAWIRFYRPDANTPNSTISYYSKGALIAMCLDLSLRREGHATLDDVMRRLWQDHGAGPLTEEDIAAALQICGRRSFARELQAWVHGTDELPLAELLAQHGIQVIRKPAPLAQALGLRVQERHGQIKLKVVLTGGAAETAGMAPGDEWLGVACTGKGAADADHNAWQIKSVAELAWYAGPTDGDHLIAIIARDRKILHLPLRIPADETVWALRRAPGAGSQQAWPVS